MKFFNLLILLFCLTVSPLLAQNETDADVLLKKVSEKYKAYKTAKVELDLIIKIPETEEDVVSRGTAWLKGDMFKIDFEERMLVSNTKTQWTYLKEVNEVQISNYDPATVLFLPSKIFNIYNDEFYTRVKEEYKNEKDQLVKVLEMAPVDKDRELFKILVAINTATMEIVSSEIFEKSGMRYKYKILSLETNKDFNDSFFTFDPAEYKIDEDDITDLR